MGVEKQMLSVDNGCDRQCSLEHIDGRLRALTGKRAKPAPGLAGFCKRSDNFSRSSAISGYPTKAKRKRFRAEGDFLIRALVDLVVQCRSQIGRLESEFAELEKLAGEHELPRDVLQAIHHMARRQRTLGPWRDAAARAQAWFRKDMAPFVRRLRTYKPNRTAGVGNDR